MTSCWSLLCPNSCAMHAYVLYIHMCFPNSSFMPKLQLWSNHMPALVKVSPATMSSKLHCGSRCAPKRAAGFSSLNGYRSVCAGTHMHAHHLDPPHFTHMLRRPHPTQPTQPQTTTTPSTRTHALGYGLPALAQDNESVGPLVACTCACALAVHAPGRA